MVHLHTAYPQISGYLEALETLPSLEPRSIPVAEALTKIVVGQMLSRKAAESIYQRLVVARDRLGLQGCWLLPDRLLRESGLSARKAKTIGELASRYQVCSDEIEAWRQLEYSELVREVSAIWGLSRWSVDMLAIFYFANPDVFPETDGSILRALALLEARTEGGQIEPELAQPYRSYLALSLWALLDQGILSSSSRI